MADARITDATGKRVLEIDEFNHAAARVRVIDPGADPHGVATWSLEASADNAAATVTRPGEALKRHYITSILASFSAATAGKELTLLDGAAVILRVYVHNALVLVLPKPIRITAGNAAQLTLAASGTAGTLGAVTLVGYTV